MLSSSAFYGSAKFFQVSSPSTSDSRTDCLVFFTDYKRPIIFTAVFSSPKKRRDIILMTQ